jgi:hypothetical protein
VPMLLLLLASCFCVFRVDASMKLSARAPFIVGYNNNLRISRLQPRIPRGGADTMAEDDDEDEATTKVDIREHPDFAALQSYRMQQQMLLQIRAIYLSEALAARGLPIPTVKDVATPDGAAPPQKVDWDCAMATLKEPKQCLYSFDAEPNTKVIAPLGTTDWISVSALNRLRRTDVSKVEPMWHSKYAILSSWFDPESEYSILQHVSFQGFLLNSLLTGIRLPIALGLTVMVMAVICMPILEYMVNRMIVSGILWSRWHQWSRFVHAALPLKLLMGQMAGKFVASMFDNLLKIVKDRLVELECQILEQHMPLTVGVDYDDDWEDVPDMEDADEE